MTEPDVSFTPDPLDPRLEALDNEIAELIAEALYERLLRHGFQTRDGFQTTGSKTAEPPPDTAT